MESNRSLDKSGFKKTERSLIEQTLQEVYLGLESSETFLELKKVYLQLFLQRLVPDFLFKKPEGRIRSIVEVGCGKGLLTNYLAMLLPDTQVIGIDPDPANIALAKSTIGERRNIHFYCGDAFRLSGFSCDRLILTNQFHHISEHAQYRKLLARTLDWLTPEGDLYIRQKNQGTIFNLDFWGKLFSKDENSLILNEWLRTTLQSVGYPAAEDCIAGSQIHPLLSPYLYIRSPRNGSLQFDEFSNLQKVRLQAREVARQAIASEPEYVAPRVRPVPSARPVAKDESIDDALSLIFGDVPKEFAPDF